MTLNTLHDMDIMDEVELINELTIESEPSINDFEDVIIDTVLNEDNTQFDDDIKCVVEEVEYDRSLERNVLILREITVHRQVLSFSRATLSFDNQLYMGQYLSFFIVFKIFLSCKI